MADDSGINQHKRYAMGQSIGDGNFGVAPLASTSRGSTASVGRPRTSHLGDHERDPPIDRGPGYHPAQANPYHGSSD